MHVLNLDTVRSRSAEPQARHSALAATSVSRQPHYRLGGSILVSLQLFEIQPDRVGHQMTYLILGFPGDANTWKFRYIRPIRTGAVLLYNDQILSLPHCRSPSCSR